MRFLTNAERSDFAANQSAALPGRTLQILAERAAAGQETFAQSLAAEWRRLAPTLPDNDDAPLFPRLRATLDWFSRSGDIERLKNGRYVVAPTFAVGSRDPFSAERILHLQGDSTHDEVIAGKVQEAGGTLLTETQWETVTDGDKNYPETPVGVTRRLRVPATIPFPSLTDLLNIPVFASDDADRDIPVVGPDLLWESGAESDTLSGGEWECYDPYQKNEWRWVKESPTQVPKKTPFVLFRQTGDNDFPRYFVRTGGDGSQKFRAVETLGRIRLYQLSLDRDAKNPRSLYLPASDNRLYVSLITPDSATQYLRWKSGSPPRRLGGWLECCFDDPSTRAKTADLLSVRLGFGITVGLPPGRGEKGKSHD